MRFIFDGSIVEPCWKVICINNCDFPSSIPDIDASIDWYRNFTSLFHHPFANAISIFFESLSQVVNKCHPITSSNNDAASPCLGFLPPSIICIASNNPKPTAMSGCFSNAFSIDGCLAAMPLTLD